MSRRQGAKTEMNRVRRACVGAAQKVCAGAARVLRRGARGVWAMLPAVALLIGCAGMALWAGEPVAATTIGGTTICDDSSLTEEERSLLGCGGTITDETTAQSIGKILTVVLGIVGVVAVGAIIAGGVMFMISVGDMTRVKRARDTILYGVIGLVISLLAFAIVKFVLEKL